MQYLDRISKRLDSLTLKSSDIGSDAYRALIDDDSKASHALSEFRKDAGSFYQTDLGALFDKKKQSILKSLSYSQLVDRESVIPEAHKRTFQWMLSKGTDRNFIEWLRGGNGAYWVSGKAGAGKSTLMKYLTEHSHTREMLVEWAEGKLIIAKHFFWRPGTPLQKSQDGLFRSLLLQILMKRPNLIPLVCAERWTSPYLDSALPWSHSELVKAMEVLKSGMADATKSADFDFKLCLFIDGLDEFDGDHFELVKVLSELTRPTRAKMCVSSRPWLEFLDAFGKTRWMIQVEDLTRQDMLLYVSDHLEADMKFAKLRARDAESAADLVSNVVARAEGVFLWVYLVVRSLLRGLRNEDDLSDLGRRMKALPPDLGDYFRRMLDEIEPVYRHRTARLFLTLSVARTSLPVLTFFFLDFDDVAVRDRSNTVKSLGNWPQVDERYLEALETKKRQLIAQCKDIIHITPGKVSAPVLFGETVGFLHRTVYDFINTEDTYRHLEKLAGSSFFPKKPLFNANLGQVKAMIHLSARTYIKPHLNSWILGTLFYAYELDVETIGSQRNDIFQGLDELERVISEQFKLWGFEHAILSLLGKEKVKSITHLAAVCDLASYVKHKCPNVTPLSLDQLAPGWRSPSRVEQHGFFEIVPQLPESHWRLGGDLGVSLVAMEPSLPLPTSSMFLGGFSGEQRLGFQPVRGPKEAPGKKPSDLETDDMRGLSIHDQSIGITTPDLYEPYQRNDGGRIQRGFKKFARVWRR